MAKSFLSRVKWAEHYTVDRCTEDRTESGSDLDKKLCTKVMQININEKFCAMKRRTYTVSTVTTFTDHLDLDPLTQEKKPFLSPRKKCKMRQSDNRGKFATVSTIPAVPGANFPPVSLIPVVHLDSSIANISANFQKI